MAVYVVRRLLATVPTLLLLVFAVVLFARLTPTSVIDLILQDQATNQATRQQLEAELGLDKPLPEAYVSYIGGALRGDFGTSLLNRRSVRDLVFERLPVTIELASYALILGWVGVGLGLLGAVATWNLNLGPRWYPIALVVLAIPQCWAGGKIYEILSQKTGRAVEQIERDFDRDRYMSAEEAKSYGLIDNVIAHRGDVVEETSQPAVTA